MKTCIDCRQTLPRASFYVNKRLPDGLHIYCKACQEVRAARRRARLYGLVEAAKAGPCLDCGGTFPACAMDLDHVRGVKVFDIGHAYRRVSLDALQVEIAKCERVCANCHRVRTQMRRDAK